MINAELNQDILRGGQRLPLHVLDQVLKVVSRELAVKEKKEISIAFVDPKTMKYLNRTYCGKNTITDVLSFSLEDEQMFGELILSYDQAQKQAQERKHSVRDELVFLIVHGILHLFGHDHERPVDAKKMFTIQNNLLKNLHVNPEL